MWCVCCSQFMCCLNPYGWRFTLVFPASPSPHVRPLPCCQLLHEVEVLGACSLNPNIVRFFGVCLDWPAGPLIVTEYYPCGSLFHLLEVRMTGAIAAMQLREQTDKQQ